MIAHLAEVWLALFAAFAVGSALGWLVFRWIDRSDYAFDQRELTRALGRRGRDSDEEVLPEEAVERPALPQAVALLEPPPAEPSPAARTLRERVRASALAASWRAGRAGEPAEDEAIALPPPEESSKAEPASDSRPKPKPEPERPRRPAAEAPTRSRRKPAPAQAGDTESGWEPTPGAWPPAGAGDWPVPDLPALPPPGGAGRGERGDLAAVLRPMPPPDEIWPDDEEEDRRADPEIQEAAEFLAKGPRKATKEDRPPVLPAAPDKADDLKKIRGIGAAFEKRLNRLGIYHYEQIAKWTPAEQAWIGEFFGFAGRIERDDWPGQAAALADGAKAPDPERG